MNNMIIRFAFLLVMLPCDCIAQLRSSLEKIVLINKTGYYCNIMANDQSILLTRFGIDSPERDSIYIFDKPGGMFESHPIVWDVIDSTIFQVRIYTSGDGMQYSELRGYKESKVREYSNKNTGYDYIASQNTLLDNSLPLNSYIRRIKRHEDTLKGPLFFDLIALPDSLLLFIYLDDLKIIEVWNFSRYSLAIGKANFDEGKNIMKKRRWEIVNTISADIRSPFQLLQFDNKVFALTNSGDLLDLSKSYARKVRLSAPLKSRKGIIINKKLASTKYFDVENWYPSKDNFSKIYKSSHYIKPK